ncbi:MAG: hypothetical protein AAYR33_03025 [Acetobacteraceae bacterium]
MATITVPGITGQNYQFDAPEEATSALAQQYADAIAAAVSDGTFVAVPRRFGEQQIFGRYGGLDRSVLRNES